MNAKEKTNSICCHLNNILRETYYEQIHGKKGYSLGYYTTYYYLLKEYKKAGQLCANCQDFAKKDIIRTEENEEEETIYTLHPEVKNKYSLSSEPELVEVLTNLIASIDNIPYYSSSNMYSSLDEQDENHYPLPELTNLNLAKIFNDWTKTVTRSERLKAALSEDQVMMKFLLEAAISLNYDLIKRKGDEEKEDLKKQKELVDKLLTAFAEETTNRKQKEEKSS
ncbi:1159_t:CDS:2 [Ambispora gerdemannii]|uniref:1159_t:CDS:1 n=1 Tax=Ambispora gerdemannii TaxID=144530 RepID=A0A9N9D177_9GLOM|nr:1159_t:CDS:2 [Ambispora gerdemannii]